MSTRILSSARLAGLAACVAATMSADFSYQQSSRITGGALAAIMGRAGSKGSEAMASTVLVKGNRMAHIRPDNAQVIDLDKETITNINFAKKTYTVMTFEQMKQTMQRVGQPPSGAEMSFKASVRETGKTKSIGGLNATEKIMTVSMEGGDARVPGAMTMSTDMWLAPDIPGYAEVRNFYKRMMEKTGWAPGSFGPAMGARGMSEGMAALSKEMSKLSGVPVLQVMTMSGGAMGAPRTAGADSGVALEMTIESSGFSASPVDASKFDIPAGFQKVK